ncbi:MAG: hypothetical protein U9R53_07750 [Chloroflexota bacterium]|nr:hypothetical protein [Chloroflexota bacterium]
MGWVFALPTGIFTRYMAVIDEAVGRSGPPAGCQKLLDLLGVQAHAKGTTQIPEKGPTIILANHPGAYDSIAIGSLIHRADLKFIVSKTRFYQVLPNIHPMFIYVSKDPQERLLALRGVVDHLRQGGILLQFGSGLIEPDPATHPIGDDVFSKWSPSMEIFLRKVPDTHVVPTIASGVLLDRFEKHPLTKLRRGAKDKRLLAEFMQVIQQLVFPKSVTAHPKISFGSPFTLADINGASKGRRVMSSIIARIKEQLKNHLAWIGD